MTDAAAQPRIPPIRKEELTDPAREVCAFYGEPNAWEEGSKTNIINTMAQHPPLGQAFNLWGRHLLSTNTLSPRLLEILILRVAWRVKSAYEWHNHVGYAIKAGLTKDEIHAIRDFPEGGAWTEEERAVLTAVDELLADNIIGDATWAALSKTLDRPQLMDLAFTIGHYVMMSWALSSFGVEIEGGADAIGFDLTTRSGREAGLTHKPGEHEDWIKTRGY